MKRYLETFFRYWLFVLIPFVALPAVEAYKVRNLPHQVYAGLNIYAQDSIVNSDPSNSFTTPAAVEAAEISQWLQSPSFCLAVAESSSRYVQLLRTSPNPLGQASSDLSTNVSVTAKGDNLVTIEYTSADPQLAIQIVNAVLAHATTSSESIQSVQNSGAKSIYDYQLYNAQAQERDSAAKLTAYERSHDVTADNLSAQLASDPTLATLYDQNTTDHQSVTSLRAKIQSLVAQTSIPASVVNQTGYILADPAQYYTISSRKKVLTDIGIALALGLLLSITFMVVLTALDRSLRRPEEVSTMLDLPVLAIVPFSKELAGSRRGVFGGKGKVTPRTGTKGARA